MFNPSEPLTALNNWKCNRRVAVVSASVLIWICSERGAFRARQRGRPYWEPPSVSVSLGAAKAGRSHMSHEAPLGIALLLLFVVVIYLRKALGMRKLSRRLQCQGRRGDNLASLGPSNEQTSCQSACVCVCLPSARRYVHICWITVVRWALGRRGTMWCGGRDGPLSFQWQVWTTDITDTPLHELTSWLGTQLEIKVTC